MMVVEKKEMRPKSWTDELKTISGVPGLGMHRHPPWARRAGAILGNSGSLQYLLLKSLSLMRRNKA